MNEYDGILLEFNDSDEHKREATITNLRTLADAAEEFERRFPNHLSMKEFVRRDIITEADDLFIYNEYEETPDGEFVRNHKVIDRSHDICAQEGILNHLIETPQTECRTTCCLIGIADAMGMGKYSDAYNFAALLHELFPALKGDLVDPLLHKDSETEVYDLFGTHLEPIMADRVAALRKKADELENIYND